MQDPNAAALVARQQSGARWFIWIAGLSLVNTAMAFTGGKLQFVCGLGTTLIIDQLFGQGEMAGKIIAGVVDLIIAGVFFGFGMMALKRHNWAFIIGMVFYTIDGLVCLAAFKDMLMVGFHAFALWCIFNGMKANQTIDKLGQAPAPPA